MAADSLTAPYRDTDHQSQSNTQAVLKAVRQRFPAWADQCAPYVNVLTFAEWQRRGYRVRKGEKAIRVPVLRRERRSDDDPPEGRLVRRWACLFAAPQVETR